MGAFGAVGVAAATLLAVASAGCGEDEKIEPPTPGERRIVALSPAGSFTCPADPSVSYSFSEGSLYATLRAALLDARNFGPSGRLKITFVFRPSIDRLRPRSLGQADILVVTNPAVAIDELALETMKSFLARGGSVLSLGDDVSTTLAAKGDCAADPDAELGGDAAVSGITNGPFGPVTSTFATGYNCGFRDLAAGVVVLANNEKGPNAIFHDGAMAMPGAGRTVAFGDDEVFAGAAAAGCGSGKLTTGNINETLALNTFVYLALSRPEAQ